MIILKNNTKYLKLLKFLNRKTVKVKEEYICVKNNCINVVSAIIQ